MSRQLARRAASTLVRPPRDLAARTQHQPGGGRRERGRRRGHRRRAREGRADLADAERVRGVPVGGAAGLARHHAAAGRLRDRPRLAGGRRPHGAGAARRATTRSRSWRPRSTGRSTTWPAWCAGSASRRGRSRPPPISSPPPAPRWATSAEETSTQAGAVSAAAEQVSANVSTVAASRRGDVGVDPRDRRERERGRGRRRAGRDGRGLDERDRARSWARPRRRSARS